MSKFMNTKPSPFYPPLENCTVQIQAETANIISMQDTLLCETKPANTVVDLSIQEELQPSLNIGSIGHVAHGKSTLVHELTGKRTQQFKNEVEKNMTIKLGYANAKIWKCEHCLGDLSYCSTGPNKKSGQVKCHLCQRVMILKRHISFVDCPGHDVLMATMLNGAAIMDAAVLVIAANQSCPEPQTAEHLHAVQLMGLSHMLVVQNKVDLCTESQITQNYVSIKKFIGEGTRSTISTSPIIPISAQQGWNMDSLCRYITDLPVPDRDIHSPPLMMVVRSFDVNKPGEDDIDNIKGAVAGGSLIRGHLKEGQTVEIRPGMLRPNPEKKGYYISTPIRTKIISMKSENNPLAVALPGGLVGVQTTLDPSLGKSDGLVGQMLGSPGVMPDVIQDIVISYVFFKRHDKVIDEKHFFKKFTNGMLVRLNICSCTLDATVMAHKADLLKIHLSKPCCAEIGSRIALSTNTSRLKGKWTLTAMGNILKSL